MVNYVSLFGFRRNVSNTYSKQPFIYLKSEQEYQNFYGEDASVNVVTQEEHPSPTK